MMCHVRRFFLGERSTPTELRVVHRVVRAIVRDVPEKTPANAKSASHCVGATASNANPAAYMTGADAAGGNTNRHLSIGAL